MIDWICDLDPRSWLRPYKENSVLYLAMMGLFYLGIGILFQYTTNLVLIHFVPEYKIPSVPISITMGLTSAPLEEITFFGIPYYITGNPFVILAGGIVWSFLHVFNTTTFLFSDLAYGALAFTVPHIFFSLRTWQSKKGWFAIVFHFAWNGIILTLGCLGSAYTCIIIGNGLYLVLDLLSVCAVIALPIMMYRANRYRTRI